MYILKKKVMANFDTIKTAIDANINTNGNQAITGGKMNSILHQMIGATDEQLTELGSEKSPVISIFGEDVILGYGLTSEGIEKADNYLITPYIPVKNGDSVAITHRIPTSTNFIIEVYDSEKNFLDRWGAGVGGRTITIGLSNAAYLRATMYAASADQTFVSINDVKVWNDDYYKITIKGHIDKVGENISEINKGLSSVANKNAELESAAEELRQEKTNSSIIFGEGVLFDSAISSNGIEKASGYLITPYIPVKNGDSATIIHRIPTTTSYRIVVYDSDLNILDAWGVGIGGRTITISFPNAAYLRATMYSTSENQTFVSINGDKAWDDDFYKKSLKEHIKDVDDEVKELQSLHKDNLLIPALPDYYYYSDYIDTKIKVINEEIRKCSNNGDIFFWMTDVHWESDKNARMSPSLINYIRQRTNIIRLFNGGDNHDGVMSDTYDDGALDYINKMKQALGTNKIYIAYGNHEMIKGESYAELFYASRQHNDDVIFGDADKSYFYTENEQQKVRYIVLNPFAPSDVIGSFTNAYENDPKQLDWLRNVALNVEEDWTCIIFTHSIFMITLPSKAIAPIYIADVNEYYGEPWSGVIWWINAINNYKDEVKGIVVDANGLSESTSRPSDRFGIRLVYDRQENNQYIYRRYMCKREWASTDQVFKYRWYEFGQYTSETLLNIGDEIVIWQGSKGTLAGVIQGHTHEDRIHISPTGVPYVITACDKWTIGYSSDGTPDLDVDRVPGTRSENHFEVVILNKNIRQLTFIAIGAKSTNGIDSAVGEEVEIRSVSY